MRLTSMQDFGEGDCYFERDRPRSRVKARSLSGVLFSTQVLPKRPCDDGTRKVDLSV